MADHIVHEHDRDEDGDKHVIHEYRDSDPGVGDGILAFLILVIILAAIGLVIWRYLPSRASNNNSSIELRLPNMNQSSGTNSGSGGGGPGGSGAGGNTY